MHQQRQHSRLQGGKDPYFISCVQKVRIIKHFMRKTYSLFKKIQNFFDQFSVGRNHLPTTLTLSKSNEVRGKSDLAKVKKSACISHSVSLLFVKDCKMFRLNYERELPSSCEVRKGFSNERECVSLRVGYILAHLPAIVSCTAP